ncbi:MAG: hypothetical protein IH803_04075 [Nitrospirae bacterium]|nr:hypothetical protein [Nitrospirota bacterium]
MKRRNEIDTLRFFNEKVAVVEGLSFAAKAATQQVRAVVEWKRGKGWESIYVGPEWEPIHALVLTLRFFVQDNEAISLRKMAKLYGRLKIARATAGEFLALRKELNDFLDSTTSISIQEGRQLSHRDVFQLFLYGDLAHGTRKKRQTVQSFSRTPFFSIVQADFARTLIVFVRVLPELKRVNGRALREILGT